MAVTAARLAPVFVEIAAASRDDDFDVGAFLRLVTARAAEVLSSDAVGLLVSYPPTPGGVMRERRRPSISPRALVDADPQGQLQFVAGSDETTSVLELFQLQHHEGPCLECFRSGTPVVIANLAEAESRWPRFVPLAVAAGFRSVHAIPLRESHHGTIGAMNFFDTSTGRLEPDDVPIVQSLADVTTIRLLQERVIRGAQVLTDQLQTALDTRVVIEQAKGVLAQLHGISMDEAFDILRAYCRRHHQRMDDFVAMFVADPSKIPAELRPAD